MRGDTVMMPDGRLLGFAEYGDLSGVPIVCCHGVPGGRSLYFDEDSLATGGVRMLAVERAGFGLSDPAPGHSLLDAAGDVAVLADQLNLDRFAVLGLSLGAPTAVATAHTCGDRVVAVGLACGVGPVFDTPRFDAVLPLEWQALLPIARQDPVTATELLRAVSAPIAALCAEDPDAQFEAMLETASPADRDEMVAARDFVVANLRTTYRRGPETFVDEVMASVGPWGFEPSEVVVPCHLWHGDRDDVAPIEVARFMAESLPNSNLTVYPGEGHFLASTHHGSWIAELAQAW